MTFAAEWTIIDRSRRQDGEKMNYQGIIRRLAFSNYLGDWNVDVISTPITPSSGSDDFKMGAVRTYSFDLQVSHSLFTVVSVHRFPLDYLRQHRTHLPRLVRSALW